MSEYTIVRLHEVDDWLGDYPGEMRGITYAIGAGIPILLIAYGGQYATTQVRRFARYTPALQRTFGAAVLLVALAFYTQYDTIVAGWLSDLYPNLQLGL